MDDQPDDVPQLLFSPPPIIPDVKSRLKNYVLCSDKLSINSVDRLQCYWPRDPDILSLLNVDLAPSGTTLKFERDPITGQTKEMQEVLLKTTGQTAKNSMSMNRAPGSLDDGVKGNSSNVLFWPGGFDIPEVPENIVINDIDFETNLRTLAKGFTSGIEFASDNCTPKEQVVNSCENDDCLVEDDNKIYVDKESQKVNLMAIVNHEESMIGLSPSLKQETDSCEKVYDESSDNDDNEILNNITTQDGPITPILKISIPVSKTIKTEWAEQLNVSEPITDFEKKLPDPAIKFPYELDIFQKQAILKLEESCNVFVAAHTSAGKTTVAEYAIALSQKHMTRVIYTSPIKALSNQKYGDFKKKFESVGLLTGDLQINQTASCLIMTTEILQSMLYCASDVLRDLEFVIFDEVHYINNEDRGHVWEEIVILLPQTVTIVMLSATVPNPIIFANWVGSIKKNKVYVISTPKRPVPLQHYLYVADPRPKKSEGKQFMILNSEQEFLYMNWYEAVQYQKKLKDEDYQQKDGKLKTPKEGKGRNFDNNVKKQKEERKLWKQAVSDLKKNDMMPVVIFTLSRQRCDDNAKALFDCNISLTTDEEQEKITNFFNASIKCLKGTDKILPQVQTMSKLLIRGIGIHHSGILPILKEIVEILFQCGAVKLLFATETFAMGVNMPARTVVFNSTRKFDGHDFRDLHPTEYIQMAGRAGRRGHDTTGKVLLICRGEIPKMECLKKMMCGQPQTLESKFKVTYRMVLNLRRVNESISVEAMLRKSFKEIHLIKKETTSKTEIQKIDEQLLSLPEFTEEQKKLHEFYKIAINYLNLLKKLKPGMLSAQKVSKSLSEGRILLVTYRHHYRKLGLLLKVIINEKLGNQYMVLVLNDAEKTNNHADIATVNEEDKPDIWYDVIGLTKTGIFVPTGTPSHEILTLQAWNIVHITKRTIHIDYSTVISDYQKRQIERFKLDPPGPTCQITVRNLLALTYEASKNPDELKPYISQQTTPNEKKIKARNFMKLSVNNETVAHLKELEDQLHDLTFSEIPNFESEFEVVFHRCELERKRRELQLTDQDLALYPDYKNMVALLKHLGYIETDERVALKGRVALQMGTNELLITELILKDVLTRLEPAEIAALLSAVIFQQRTKKIVPVSERLEERKKVIEGIYEDLAELERMYSLQTLQPLNFGLVSVVYEWAKGKSFAKIMELINDVQEGIIVRCIQQLDETLHDVKNAALVIGDPILKEKMEEASTAIKRDIVFAASLYTQDSSD